jgi:tryptophan 2,3-dioxygenase
MILIVLLKRIVYYVLAAGPFLLVGLIAINSRMNTNHWEFIEYGPETMRRIEAYAGPVAQSREAIHKGRATSREALREALDSWLLPARNGELKDIPPPTALNEGTTSVYSQILDAKQTLLDVAMREGTALAEAGRHRDAAMLYADVLEIADAGKYSEFSSVSEASTYQVASLKRIADLADKLSAADQAAIIARVDRLEGEPGRTLVHVVDRLSAVYAVDLRRQGRSPLPVEASKAREELASNSDPTATSLESWQALSKREDSLLSMYGRSKVAYVQYVRYMAQRSRTLELLSGQKAS